MPQQLTLSQHYALSRITDRLSERVAFIPHHGVTLVTFSTKFNRCVFTAPGASF